MTNQVQQSENRHDGAGSRKETRTAGFGQTVLEPFLVFLRLGLTSFGGPIAHLGYFRQECVERRKWLSEQTFADLVALEYRDSMLVQYAKRLIRNVSAD
jgi:chromate transporter